MNDTERLDFLSKIVAKGHDLRIERNGTLICAHLFGRQGYGDNMRAALDKLHENMSKTIAERVARRLAE